MCRGKRASEIRDGDEVPAAYRDMADRQVIRALVRC